MSQWKEGDWCFFEFRLCQIREMEEGRITELNDSMFSTGGRDLSDRCYPLSLEALRVTTEYEATNTRLHREFRNLNFPDVHRHLVMLWRRDCNRMLADDKENVFSELSQFMKDIEQAARVHSQGVSLFRGR